MQDKDLKKIMDTWAEHEVESAPEMRPTADMVRMVQARRKRKFSPLVFSRRAIIGAAVANLVVAAILYAVLFRPSTPSDVPPSQQIASVGQREGFAERGVVIQEPGTPPDKERGKGPVPLEQLAFHFQKQDSRIHSIDLQALPEETITLSTSDNYRLLLEPAQDCYLYVFQWTSSYTLVKLFPNETYSLVQNPLRRGQTLYLPSDPNWFYLGENEGQERLYVIASAQSLQDLENLYAQYDQADDAAQEQETLSNLLSRLENIAQLAGWVFEFDHQ